jgi:hypothetical protein
MLIQVWVKVQDSSKRYAPDYLRTIEGELIKYVRFAHCQTPLDLYREVFESVIMDLERHEAREFFRVGDDYSAPFHPHTTEGKINHDQYGRAE